MSRRFSRPSWRRVAALAAAAALLSACVGEETSSFRLEASRDAGSSGDTGLSPDTSDADAGASADASDAGWSDLDLGPADTSDEAPGDTDEVTEADVAGDPIDLGTDSDAGDGGSPDDLVDEEPDAPPPTFSFVVFGDNQFATTSCTSGTPERMAVPEVVTDLLPDFLLHTGDLMDHGYEEGAYAHFVDCYSEMLATIPFFPTGGNHDFGNNGILRYKTFLEERLFDVNPRVYPGVYSDDFDIAYEDDPVEWSTDRDEPSDRDLLPSGVTFKTYYAFRHQNAYFISFEQGTRWWTQTPKPWLEDHLAAAQADPDIDHIFVTMHHPMYSATMPETDDGECIEPVRRHYESTFRDYDVTVVFSGHAHCYDRFYVPDDGSPTRASPPPSSYPHDGSGVHYIVTGGGGGGLTNGCDPFPERHEHSYAYSQARGCFHHVTQVEVEGETVTISIWRIEGGADDYVATRVDRFRIE